MLIGGYSYNSPTGRYLNNTYYFNPMYDKPTNWIDGPSLLEARDSHASTILGHHIVTGGGLRDLNANRLSSVEILDLQSFPHQWTQGKFCYVWNETFSWWIYFFSGPSLPKIKAGHSMVTITDKIILLGGRYGLSSYSKDVLALDCIDCNWRSIGELQHARRYFVAIPIPSNFTFEC